MRPCSKAPLGVVQAALDLESWVPERFAGVDQLAPSASEALAPLWGARCEALLKVAARRDPSGSTGAGQVQAASDLLPIWGVGLVWIPLDTGEHHRKEHEADPKNKTPEGPLGLPRHHLRRRRGGGPARGGPLRARLALESAEHGGHPLDPWEGALHRWRSARLGLLWPPWSVRRGLLCLGDRAARGAL